MSKPWYDIAWWEALFAFLAGVAGKFGFDRVRRKP